MHNDYERYDFWHRELASISKEASEGLAEKSLSEEAQSEEAAIAQDIQ